MLFQDRLLGLWIILGSGKRFMCGTFDTILGFLRFTHPLAPITILIILDKYFATQIHILLDDTYILRTKLKNFPRNKAGDNGYLISITWWCHPMDTFSALLAICAGNSQVPGEFPTERPVTRSFDIFFDLRPNKLVIWDPIVPIMTSL